MNNEVNFDGRRTVRRSLLAGAVSAALLVSSAAHALGLGEAEVQSFLNQPLKVRIPIIIENEGERESLRVDLAATEDFRKVGLDRAALGLSLDVELEEKDGAFTVLLSSTAPVGDPFLQILINADWSSGRLLRQYTLFLDPPLLETPSIQVRNEPPPASTRSGSTRPASTRSRPSGSSSGSRPARASISGNSYGPVGAGETLWSIASRSNPNSSQYSVNQVMLAYVRLNPEAFHQGNVNSLRRGASLAVPGTQDIAVVNAQEALRIVQQQHREWRSDFSGGGSSSGSRSNEQNNSRTASRSSNSDRASVPDGRLQLVPPDESTAPITNSAGLKAELARLEEELLTARLENKDLIQQVENLREEISRLEGSGLQDRSLAEFQNYLGEEQSAEEDQAYVDPFVNQGFDPQEEDAFGEGVATTDDPMADAGANDEAGADGLNTAQDQSSTTPMNTVVQNNTPPTIVSDQPPVSATPAQGNDSFFSPFTIALAGVGALAVALLIWTQRRGSQSGSGQGDKAKSRFSAKNLLAANKEKKAKKEKPAKKEKIAKKSGAASLADRLIEASKQQKVEPPPPPPAAEPAPPPPPVDDFSPFDEPAPPPEQEEETLASLPENDFTATPQSRDLSGNDMAEEPASLGAMAEPEPEPEEELDQGLDFVMNDEPEPAAEEDNTQDAADDLLRRLASEEEADFSEDEAKAQETESGLDFDLSGMEHLISSSGTEDDTKLAQESAEEEDPYEAVLRGMAADDEPDDVLLSGGSQDDDELMDSMAGPDEDEVEIKLDLARAYISMGDNEAASTILDEILSEGSDVQRAEARNLLKQV